MKKRFIAILAVAVFQAYGSTVMIVNSSSGSRDVYQLASVQKMSFENMSIGIHPGNTLSAPDNSFRITRTMLRLTIVKNTPVQARLFSCDGRLAGTLTDRNFNPGSYTLSLDRPSAYSRGVYILQITMAGKTYRQKFVVAR